MRALREPWLVPMRIALFRRLHFSTSGVKICPECRTHLSGALSSLGEVASFQRQGTLIRRLQSTPAV